MEAEFCVSALEEALWHYGAPEICSTDQGSQFTSEEFTGVLKVAGVRISMDSKSRWLDNVFIERLWRSLKYDEIYLKAYASVVAHARPGIGVGIEYYNSERRLQSLNLLIPEMAYSGNLPTDESRAA